MLRFVVSKCGSYFYFIYFSTKSLLIHHFAALWVWEKWGFMFAARPACTAHLINKVDFDLTEIKHHTDLPSDSAGQVQFGETGQQLAAGSQSELRLWAALRCRQQTDAGEEEGRPGHRVGQQQPVLQKQRHHAARGGGGQEQEQWCASSSLIFLPQ